MSTTAPTLPMPANIFAFHIIVQTNNKSAAQSSTGITGDTTLPLQRIYERFKRFTLGSFRSNTYVVPSVTYASDLVTFSSLANNDTVTVNGRLYTAKTSGASGANQFNLGTTDTTAATNFAAAVNADTNTAVKGVITAVASTNTITLFCLIPGNIGLQMTAAISAHGTVATANFTGGSEGTAATISHGL